MISGSCIDAHNITMLLLNGAVKANFTKGANATSPSKTQTGSVTLSPGATPAPEIEMTK